MFSLFSSKKIYNMRTASTLLLLLAAPLIANSRVISRNALAQSKSLAQKSSGNGIDTGKEFHDHSYVNE